MKKLKRNALVITCYCCKDKCKFTLFICNCAAVQKAKRVNNVI